MQLPVLIDAPARPIPLREVPVRPGTSPRRFAIAMITRDPRRLAPGALLACSHQVGEALVPLVLGQAVDAAVGPSDGGALLLWLLVLAAVFAQLSFSFRFASRLGWLGMNAIEHRLRMEVTDRMLAPSGVSGRAGRVGAQLSLATSDTGMLARACGLVIYGPSVTVGLLVAVIALLVVSLPLGLAAIAGAVVVVVLGERIGPLLRRRVVGSQSALADTAGAAADLLQGLGVIKGLGAQRIASRRYATSSDVALGAQLRTARAEAVTEGVLELAGLVFVSSIAVAGTLMAVDGDLSVGQLVTVVMLAGFLLEPLGAYPHLIGFFWLPALGAAERLLPLLTSQPAVTEPAPGQERDVESEDGLGVELGAPEGPAVAQPGRLTVVCAPADLTDRWVDGLARTGDPQLSIRLVDGTGRDERVDVGDLRVVRQRELVVVAPHLPHLFAGTLADNIALGSPAPLDDDRWQQVMAASACDQVAETVPGGLEAAVGDQGNALSGGQRQRVGLARALAADAPVLVLVDPTSGVDSVTEQRIATAVASMRRGRTTVVLTHSPTWSSVADRTVVTGSADE